ncbi:MAG: hypothetical protein SCK29_07645 [Bacillota bacterium]|nr:hypothetical protein [Bacillota bacterium]MDW7683973.1 hypothetical protein [Bacillota bacterium]
MIKNLAYLDFEQKSHRETLTRHLTMILLDVDKSIVNCEDRQVIQEKLFELLSVHNYFHLSPGTDDFLTPAWW